MLHAVFSRPPAERPGTHLLIMLHGYGSTEQRMVELFDVLPENTTGAALRGPFAVGGDHGWFLLDYFLAHDFAAVVAAVQQVYDWQDAHSAQHESVSVLGYSQGMAMATTMMRLRPGRYAAGVGLNGFVLHSELLALTDDVPADPALRVPFFWGRDPEDPVINQDAAEHTAAWLEDSTRLTSRRYPGMGHGISAEERRDAAAFLRHYLP
ncbi:alpha/beta hydrolase [Zafaria sp. Z1313]|uniref:alpha/beta hydrolase n=1 Tax=unclassified Zafaria TaxID=2828765 RepID=UPI002E792001|nr:phospholipase [Zafaria sp. J156]MEE1622108.1 phospholipase [Zafaria sp. J156]